MHVSFPQQYYSLILQILDAVHPIRAELGEPSDMRMAIRISLIICALFYFSIGFFGYLLFGDSIDADMLVNFDQIGHDTVVGLVINSIVRLSYAVHLMLVFPLINYCLRANIDELIFPNKPDLATNTTRFICITCIPLALAYVIAIWIPSIWYCFQILGSTTVVCLILIFPSSIILRYFFFILFLGRGVFFVCLLLIEPWLSRAYFTEDPPSPLKNFSFLEPY